jgi:hypothetical protein
MVRNNSGGMTKPPLSMKSFISLNNSITIAPPTFFIP